MKIKPDLIWEVVKFGILGMAAIFSFNASQQAEKARLEVEQARREAEQRSMQAQLNIRAYEMVEKALSLDAKLREGHAIAAAAIVNALTQPPLRVGLHNALRAVVTNPELIRKLDAAIQFDLDELPPPPESVAPKSSFADFLVASAWAASLRDFRVEIFYCEGATPAVTNARKARAEQALARVQKSGVNARVRLLPTLVQARPGYQSYADEVRFSAGPERSAAAELANIVGIKASALRAVATPTPGYLSAFYCAG
jgi:hypothetical protein